MAPETQQNTESENGRREASDVERLVMPKRCKYWKILNPKYPAESWGVCKWTDTNKVYVPVWMYRTMPHNSGAVSRACFDTCPVFEKA